MSKRTFISHGVKNAAVDEVVINGKDKADVAKKIGVPTGYITRWIESGYGSKTIVPPKPAEKAKNCQGV